MFFVFLLFVTFFLQLCGRWHLVPSAYGAGSTLTVSIALLSVWAVYTHGWSCFT